MLWADAEGRKIVFFGAHVVRKQSTMLVPNRDTSLASHAGGPMSYKVMQIETSNRCTLRCVYCPHPTQIRPKGDMTFETFKASVEAVRRSANPEYKGRKFVFLNHFGEPLLNPMLADFISYAVCHGVEVTFATNAVDHNKNLFPRQLWEELASAGLKIVEISTHAKSESTIRRHIGDLVGIRSVWKPIKGLMHDWAGQVEVQASKRIEFELPSRPCDYEEHNMFAIAWDGRIASCCYDVEARTGIHIANVLEDGFKFRSVSICMNCRLGRGDAKWLEDALPLAESINVLVRGTIEQVDGPVLTIKSGDGDKLKVRMADDAEVMALVKASLADIKPGSFVGSTAMPEKDGRWKAVEVHIFPEAMRGTGEGDRPYDYQPKSTMTNGTVNALTKSTVGAKLIERAGASLNGGRHLRVSNWCRQQKLASLLHLVQPAVEKSEVTTLTLNYKEGEKKIDVTPDTVIVIYTPGSKEELKSGAKIYIPAATRQADGTLMTARVNVGRGVTPPM